MFDTEKTPQLFVPTEIIAMTNGRKDGLKNKDLNVYLQTLSQRDQQIIESGYKLGVRGTFAINGDAIAEQIDGTTKTVLKCLYRLQDGGWLAVEDASDTDAIRLRFSKKIPPVWKPKKAAKH